jgi:hypothetical protein
MNYSENLEKVSDYSPIAIFGYNRPDHLARVLNSLAKNNDARDSEIYIFLDGPRQSDNLQTLKNVREVAEFASGFKSKEIIVRSSNFGLAKSIVTGVEHVLDYHESIIVIEDDLVLAPGFLKFMNAGLNYYRDEKRVGSIHGYQYPLSKPLVEPVFLRGADCWGWGTWRDRWELVSFNPSELINEIEKRDLTLEFSFGGQMPFFEMLKKLERGEIDSWAICWHASLFLRNLLTLYPPRSLVKNEGNDGTGVHSGVNSIFVTTISEESDWKLPTKIKADEAFTNLLGEFYGQYFGREQKFSRITNRMKYNLKRYLKVFSS